jgi:G3E family GTPase
LCHATQQPLNATQPLQNAFDYIVIEASGICEPAPIAQTIYSYPSMVTTSSAPLPQLDAVVTVVDAMRLRDEFAGGDDLQRTCIPQEDLASLVIQQIEFCNLILLNKASEVTKEELEHIRAIIRAIQPKAKIIDCDYCDVPFGEILDTNLFDFEQVATSATWIQKVEGDIEEEHGHHHHEHGEHCHCHEHHDHDHECDDPHCCCHHHYHNHGDEYGISTFVYYRREPFSLNRFDEFVARHWDKGIIRCKGMCYFEEEYDMCYLFEQAGKQFDLKQAGTFYATMPKEELMQMMASDPMLQRDWDEYYGDRMQKLVFIGQNMDRDAITKALDACLV